MPKFPCAAFLVCRCLLAKQCFFALFVCSTAHAAEIPFRPQEISNRLTVGYAVRLADVNGDRRDDIVVVDTDRVVWFENPTWQEHTLIEHQTKKDNVSIAPADIDGDGRVDFALGADWRPSDTRTSGSIQWLARGKSPDDKWTVHPIGTEPTVHRVRFADLDADGRDELIVVPLFGKGSTPPHFAETPVRILAYKIPADPVKDAWQPRVLDETTHVTHNFWPCDLNRDGKLDILLASFEGASVLERQPDNSWRRTLIGTGNQQTSPNRGASEIKLGRLGSGGDYIATIEPWHGFQVVVYTRPDSAGSGDAGPLWPRQVIDDELKWGHAVSCADLDGDAAEELIIGVRDSKDAASPCGLRIYDPADAAGQKWTSQRVDPGGVAIEDLAVGDLDADGRADIVAVGRATKNVRIYWNQVATSVRAESDFPLETLPEMTTGRDLSLGDARGRAGTVLVSISIECPISNEYVTTLVRIAEAYKPRGVNFVGFNPNGGETPRAVADYARENKISFPIVQDSGGKIARRLLVSVTPEVRVFDAEGKLIYSGRIDDRYRARGGGVPAQRDLENALDELLAGKPISVTKTRPMGCPLQINPQAAPPVRAEPLPKR